MWDSSVLEFSLSVKNRFFLRLSGVIKGSGDRINVINVYAPQGVAAKNELWGLIEREMGSASGFWVTLGDFNAVRFAEERKGSVFKHACASNFNGFIHRTGLLEYGLKGSQFTCIRDNGRKLSKIDRVLVCSSFFNKWPEACLRVLPSRFSDHCPLFLSSKSSGFGARPFRVFNSWLRMDGYEEMVKEAISSFEFDGPPDTKLTKMFAFLRVRIKSWKEEMDAKFFLEENLASADIGKLEEVMGERDLDEEEEWIYVESKKVLKEASVKKAMDLKQRSRIRWAIDGDENSSFFYGIVNGKKASNNIPGLSINGVWVSKPSLVKKEIYNFFGCKFHEENVVRVLRCFHICSGLKINLCKSNMFGIGVNLVEVEEEALVLGSRLSKWKASCLSIGGRITLIKAVLESLPCYYFSIYRAPVKVINDLEGLIRRFLGGGGSSGVSKIHWVAWDRVAIPKKVGGLGLCKLKISNVALLSKWGWRFKAEKRCLWSKVIEALHSSGRCWDFIPSNQALGGVLNNIVKVISRTVISNMPLRRFCKGLVGDGENIAFWLDPWVCDAPLKDLCPNLFRLQKEKKCRVKCRTVVDGVGSGMGERWRWARSPASDQEVAELDFLVSVLDFVVLSGSRDKWLWLGDKSGAFSVSSVRQLIYSESDFSNNYVLEWCKWIPAKCNVFIWQAEMSKIPTADALRRRNMVGVEATCSICNEDNESVEHLFTSCRVAMVVWSHICSWTRVQRFFAFSFRDLIEVHEHVGLRGKAKKVFHGIILLSCWAIWRARNRSKFDGKSVKPEEIISDIKSIGFLWVRSRAKLANVTWSDWCKYDIV
ncbi:RNA-directed DNA polymerase, eukaryota [Artemisia annua]|uniref:RNA-directed DNA polymerase, eukaryota n=1 Tax=Artemisia annua TaxID=35608 RepID=A0A2U1NLK0_ARTAN|nr:RNA-directed DNA polymerase, eukaryota [Artemisia annua]